MLDRVSFVLGETLIALGRNRLLALAAVVTVALSLYLMAGIGYVGYQASGYLAKVPGHFEMEINLKPEVTASDVARTAKYLRLAPGVSRVVWIPAKRQFELWKRDHPEEAEGLGDESPFAEKLRVTLNDLSRGDAVAATAHRMTTVDPVNGVVYYREAQNAVAAWIPLLRWIALGIGVVLLGVSTVLIATAIRLTVESRRMEVRIMRLVGASRIVVALPFVLEGVLQGAMGGGLATLGLWASQREIEARLALLPIGVSLAPFPTLLALGVLCGVGGGYGGIWSLISLRGTMRSRFG